MEQSTSRRPFGGKKSPSRAVRARFGRSPKPARMAPWRLPAWRWRHYSRSGSPSFSSSICPQAPLVEQAEISERRWAYVVAGVVFLVFAVIVYNGVHWAVQPPSNVETIDAGRLHLAGEFVEANLGTEVVPDG